MRANQIRIPLIALALAVATLLAADNSTKNGSEEPKITVSGDLPNSGVFSLTELQKIGTAEFDWTHDGRTHRCEGLSLDRLIDHLGFSPGEGGRNIARVDRRPGWKKILIVEGADGYQAIFTCAEISEAMGVTRAYVVWGIDGQPVAEEDGPLRIIVTTDKKGSRSVRQLKRIEIADLRKWISPQDKAN
jgi:hypothetical protein